MKHIVTHHINGNIDDNRPENLGYLFQSSDGVKWEPLKITPPKPKRKSNLARVLYKHTTDGMIQIVGLEGFLTMDKIEKKYGKEVRLQYQKDVSCDGGKTGNNYMIQGTKDYTNEQCVRFWLTKPVFLGDKYTKEKFHELVSTMKLCGKRLSEIVKQVRSQKDDVKVIEI